MATHPLFFTIKTSKNSLYQMLLQIHLGRWVTLVLNTTRHLFCTLQCSGEKGGFKKKGIKISCWVICYIVHQAKFCLPIIQPRRENTILNIECAHYYSGVSGLTRWRERCLPHLLYRHQPIRPQICNSSQTRSQVRKWSLVEWKRLTVQEEMNSIMSPISPNFKIIWNYFVFPHFPILCLHKYHFGGGI